MRGNKLTAWKIPAIWEDLQKNNLSSPEGSSVPQKQKLLLKATREVLTAVAEDMRQGLLETVGVESSLSIDGGRCSMILELPEKADTEQIAQAIDLENIEAWIDDENRVHIAVSPWYSTKDVDQTVLSAVKVIHVLLGIHASDNAPSRSFGQKIIAAIMDVMNAQKTTEK